MIGAAFFYAGLIGALAGAVSLIRPPAILGIRGRRQALLLLAACLGLSALTLLLPAKETRIEAPRTRLDEFSPRFQFNELHAVRVEAPRERVYEAIKAVRADEILLFRTLTWLRRLGRPGPESILNAPERLPILDVATRTSFLLLAEEPGREIVVGTVVIAPAGTRLGGKPTPEQFRTLDAPGFAKATMSFLVVDAGAGACLVKTETRVQATDPSTRRRFAVYWRVIYPGSALIRRMWLRAIKLRAEAAGSQPPA